MSFPAHLPLALIILVAGTPAPSSPISPPEAPPEGLPEAKTVARKTELDETTPADVRALIERGQDRPALERLRKLIARRPDPGDAAPLRLLEARLLERLGEDWDAAQVYRDLLERPEVDAEARTELHALYVRRGQFRAADRLTAEPDTAGPDERRARLRAFSWSTQARFHEAVLALEGVDGGAAAVLRGNALLALGRRDEARDAFLDALAEPAPREVLQAAHYGLGQVARLAGARAVRALEDEKAERLGPMPAAELDAGLALRALGRTEEARAKLARVAEAWPVLAPTARLSLARLDEDAGHTEAALEELAAAVTGQFGDVLPLTRLGELLERRGNEEAAVESYRSALAIAPGFAPARDRLSRLLMAQGRWDEVPEPAGDDPLEVAHERLLDGDLPYHDLVAERDSVPPDDPRRALLALVQLRAGFPAAALAWTDDAAAGAGDAAALRAEALRVVKRTEEAAALWSEQLALGERIAAREGLLRVAVEKGDKAEAVRQWEELSRRHPAEPRALARIAEVFDREGWKAEAKESWERALGAGYLTPDERRRVRERLADVEDEIEEERQTRDES